MTVPSWVKEAIFYHIFPDRFANGDPENDPVNVHPWGNPPTIRGFQGGDLKGITHHIDYLVDLGINAIYLNPIFMAPSTHRYDTFDYLRIDPKLGDLADFNLLIETAHRNNIHVILDGVFNHCGRGFFAFNDILENGEESPYLNWFHIKRFPVNAYGKGQAKNFLAWWGIKSLPKFNTNNPYVRRYLLDVARYWIEIGADGWRLDVPNEIDDDGFWEEFRHVVKTANTNAYILGEIWDVQPRWVNDNHFDGLMNYPVRKDVLELLTGKQKCVQFANHVEQLLNVYPVENVYAQYLLLGSHDTERILTLFKNDVQKVKLAFLFLFAYPGAPAVYYGDEIGMNGGNDPDCRRAFSWEPENWNHDLRGWVKALIDERRRQPALTHGDMIHLYASDSPNIYCFSRVIDQDQILVAINADNQPAAIQIPVEGLRFHHDQILHNLVGTGIAAVNNRVLNLNLPAMSGAMFK